MNQEFLSDQEVVRVTNEQFVTIKREDLSCDCDLDVDISTVEIDNLKAQDMAFMLQTMGPKADPKIAFRIMGDIAELKRMPELAHWLKTYEPKPDPLVEEAKKLEVIKLQKEVELLDSEIALNRAKAAETMSKKDAIDLNYVEQETGTKHARDMQKQQAQAEGNQALQVTKALTTPLKTGEKVPNVEAAIGFNQISAMLSGQNKGPRLFSGMNG
jgi:hypothetical protein